MAESISKLLPEYFEETADIIHKRMLEEAPDGISTIEGGLFWSATRGCAKEIAAAKRLNLIQTLSRGITQTAKDGFLDLQGEADGIPRKDGEKAIQKLLFIGKEGTRISAGRIVSTESDDDNESIQFMVLETVTIGPEGTVYANAECLTEGKIGNVIPGAIKILNKSIDGVKQVTNTEIVKEGVDKESDADYLERILDNAANPPSSGNIAHYKKWAKECIGVKACKVIPLWDKNNGRDGRGTVKVIIVADGNKAATDELVQEVKTYIDPYPEGTGSGQAPIGSTATIISATETKLNINTNIVLSTGYTIDMIKDSFNTNLSEYLSELNFEKTTYISYARIGNVLLDTEGVLDYSNLEINGADANVSLGNEEIAVTGDIVLGEV